MTPLHAALIQIGEKLLETRGVGWDHSGPTAIHATKRLPAWARELCYHDAIRTVLRAAGFNTPGDLPTGAITCVVDMHHPASTNDLRPVLGRMSANELLYGDFSPNRFAYPVDLLVVPSRPIPMRGQLGLWNVPQPTASYLLAIAEQARANGPAANGGVHVPLS